MTRLSIEAKEAMVAKALTHKGSLKALATDSGIGYSTLQKWVREVRERGSLHSTRRGRPPLGQGQTPRLQHLLATAGLDAEAIGAYCRAQGIHSFQLTQWQDELMKDDGNKKQNDAARKEINALRAELKNLKKDLYRKDKALAETTALLVLKKKADLIWGDDEDDS